MITVSLKNIPLSEAARYISELAGVKLAIRPDALVFGDAPATDTEAAAASAAGPVALPILEKARTLIVPKFFLKESTVEDAVQALKAAARESDPEGRGISILLRPGTGKELDDVRITLQLTNIPVSEALHYISELAKLDLRTEPYGFILEPKKPAKPLPIELKADNVTVKEGRTLAEGRVEIRCGKAVLTADSVYLDKTGRRADCIGQGQVKEGGKIASGDNLSVVFLEQGGISVLGSHNITVVDPALSPDAQISPLSIPPVNDPVRAGSPVEPPSLTLQAIRLKPSPDHDSAQQFTLQIPIQSLPKTGPVNVRDLTVKVMFYDILEDGNIVPTIANVNSSWEKFPPDWADGKTETLLVRYQLPKAAPEAGKSDLRKYYGFTVHLFYKNQLQSKAANPLTLLTKFPQ